jgi:adenylate cyclase, class 2
MLGVLNLIIAEPRISMHIEVEQKFRARHSLTFLARLERLGAVIEAPMVQVDQYFAHPARDFAQTDEALRIRRVGDLNFVTYKGPKLDATTKTRRELELPLTPGTQAAEEFAELLAGLGFSRVHEVRKTRTVVEVTWQSIEIEVALDDVDRLGQFVELEIVADADSATAARDKLVSLATELGLEGEERRSYLELLVVAERAVNPREGG